MLNAKAEGTLHPVHLFITTLFLYMYYYLYSADWWVIFVVHLGFTKYEALTMICKTHSHSMT